MPNLVENPYRIFTDVDGDPLENGYIYLGEPGLNPLSNPIQGYWDAELTIPASNIRTKGGYPSNNGTPGRLYTVGNYSILVRDKKQSTVYSQLDATDYYNSPTGDIVSQTDTIETLRQISPINDGYKVVVKGYYEIGDVSDIPPYYWDESSVEADNGGSVIAVAGVSPGRWVWGGISEVNAKHFGASESIADNAELINNALIYAGLGQCYLPEGSYPIQQSISIPVLASFLGNYNATRIIADFSSWKTTDYRAIIVRNKEGVNLDNEDFNRFVGQFSISTLGASSVESIGIDFSAGNPSAITGTTVNNSVYNINVANAYFEGFDTAINIYELWGSSFENIMINLCRVAVNVEGQAINNFFSDFQCTNFTSDNTSSVEETYGFRFDSSMRYDGGTDEKRPEGYTVQNCLIFGAYNNMYIRSVLALKVVDCIIDGGKAECFYFINPGDVIIDNCYIYTSGERHIYFNPLSVAQELPITLTNNMFAGSDNTVQAIYFDISGAARKGIEISSNYFYNMIQAIEMLNCPEQSLIINNNHYSAGKTIIASDEVIHVQNGGTGTLIDGNMSRDDIPIIGLHPSATGTDLVIGRNNSLTYKTYDEGVITIPAGDTQTAFTDFGFGVSEKYIRPVVVGTATQDTAMWFDPLLSNFNGRFKIPVALGSDLLIHYIVRAIPITAY